MALGVLLVILVAVAIAKPWQPSESVDTAVAPEPAAGRASAGAPTSSHTPAASAPSVPSLPPLPQPGDIGALIEYRDAWGVRAIVGRPEFAERWAPAPLPMPDGVPALEDTLVRVLHVPGSERPVRLLGFTTPVGVSIGRIEIAAARPVPGTDRVEFRPVSTIPWRGRTLLFTPPEGDDWAPGIYQFRVETGESSTSLAVMLLAGPLQR
jgi:hypothetical protein